LATYEGVRNAPSGASSLRTRVPSGRIDIAIQTASFVVNSSSSSLIASLLDSSRQALRMRRVSSSSCESPLAYDQQVSNW
jgi:hypothetical protein